MVKHDSKPKVQTATGVLDGLKKLYKEKIRPVEERYHFGDFHSPCLEESDFDAKPFILVLGQYSTGKSSFIQYLLGREYPGCRIGPEPTTDRFVAVMNGTDDRCTPGNALATRADMPFRGLQQFGTAFLNKFEGAQCEADILTKCTIIDTPGVLSGEKQRIGRSYNYPDVVRWFAERSDLILLLFDAHKLDISDEFRAVIQALNGNDDKVRVVLNKADRVSDQQLMRVYGALMWALGKCVQTPEVMRVFIGSFWDKPYEEDTNHKLFAAEREDLLKDLYSLPRNAAIRKVNEVVKRARAAKVHALIIAHLKGQMPAVFFKQSKQQELLDTMDQQFYQVQRQYNLPIGDFPQLDKFIEKYKDYDFSQFKKLDMALITKMDDVLARDLPGLMQDFPVDLDDLPFKLNIKINACTLGDGANHDDWSWDISRDDYKKYTDYFKNLAPVDGIADRTKAEELLRKSELTFKSLGQIWELADLDK
eukprot:Ihof_evm3s25 gene=Ihof_evmTU3s25